VTWFKVDDKLHAHPKWWALSPNAKALWTTAGSWCSSYKTDGVVLDAQLPILAPQVGLSVAKIRAAARELTESGMWKQTTDSKGWVFHNWTDFNPTRLQQDKEAAIERERKKIQNDPDLKAAVRLRDRDRCRYCGERVNFAARTGHLAGRYDHVIPVTKGGKTEIDNVVVCCDYDNRRKYNKTLDEAQMVLLEPPAPEPTAQPGLSPGSENAQSKTEPRHGSGPGSGLAGTGLVGSGRNGSGRVGAGSATAVLDDPPPPVPPPGEEF
jgi:5-methylcytosine-specific restriction endonuclease McrA